MTMMAMRPESTAASIQTTKAISQPAKMPRNTAGPNVTSAACCASESIADCTSGLNIGVFPMTHAKRWAPTMLAASTTHQSFATLRSVARLRRASRGMIAVRVFSVNSC